MLSAQEGEAKVGRRVGDTLSFRSCVTLIYQVSSALMTLTHVSVGGESIYPFFPSCPRVSRLNNYFQRQMLLYSHLSSHIL